MSRMGMRAAALVVIALALLASCTRHEGAPADILTNGKKLYSQHDEELIIRHFFDDRRGGFFVDVGCSHWKNASTTYYLESALGWSGIGIDGLPWLAIGYEEHRPKTQFFNYIVTDHGGTVETFYAAGVLSSTNPEHLKRFPNVHLKSKQISVPTITLNELLDREGVEHIDFLSMDIEQGEPAALAGFDIDRFKPELICIEAGAEGVREKVVPYFAEHGYVRIEEYLKHDPVNWYYKPKGHPGPS